MMITFRGESVEIEKVDGKTLDDAWIVSAYWTKTGVNLTDEELEGLEDERPDAVEEIWWQNGVAKAEDRADLLAER